LPFVLPYALLHISSVAPKCYTVNLILNQQTSARVRLDAV
jgi:hypothetical protein